MLSFSSSFHRQDCNVEECQKKKKKCRILTDFILLPQSRQNRPKIVSLLSMRPAHPNRVFGPGTVIRNNHGRRGEISVNWKNIARRFRKNRARCCLFSFRALGIHARVINARSKLLMRQAERAQFIWHFRHASAFIRFAYAGGILKIRRTHGIDPDGVGRPERGEFIDNKSFPRPWPFWILKAEIYYS